MGEVRSDPSAFVCTGRAEAVPSQYRQTLSDRKAFLSGKIQCIRLLASFPSRVSLRKYGQQLTTCVVRHEPFATVDALKRGLLYRVTMNMKISIEN